MAEIDRDRRIRWGRWIGGSLISLILLLLVAHAVWSSVASSRLQQQIKAARDAGEPVLPADFAASNVDSPDNAGPDIVAAAGLLDFKATEWKNYDNLLEPLGIPLRDNERQVVAAVIPQLVPTFERLEKTRGKNRFDWDLDVTSPMFGKLPPDLNTLRSLAMALQMQAMFDHDQQHHRAALDRAEQIFFMSRYPDRYPSLVTHLVAIGCSAVGSDLLMGMAPDLRIGEEANDASPQQVRRTIEMLLDERATTEGLLFSLQGERMMQLDTMNCMVNGIPMGAAPGAPATKWHPLSRYFAKPVLSRNAATMFKHMSGMIAATPEKSWPAFRAKSPAFKESGSIVDMLSNLLLPSLDRIGETHFRGLTDRRLAAVALAVRWYGVEHNGEVPLKLDDLVPKYLPAIPLDPLAADGKGLNYLPGAGKPIAWSVGTNGTDENGSEVGTNPKRPPRHEWEMQDRIVPLYRRPRPAPLTEPEP